MTNLYSVLVIDDEAQIRKLLEISLEANGYKVLFAVNGKDGITACASHLPDMVLLDLGLPDIDGQKVLQQLREWYTRPIIILSVKSAEDEIVRALDQGANDYLTKPFRTQELLARMRTALRLSYSNANESIQEFGGLTIDYVARVIKLNGTLIKLTATEYNLLTLLTKNEGRVLTHQFILKEIWGNSYVEQTQYLRVFIAQLRKKIEINPNIPKYIVTESGVGYRFNSS